MTRLEGIVPIDSSPVTASADYPTILTSFELFLERQGMKFESRKELLHSMPSLIDGYRQHLMLSAISTEAAADQTAMVLQYCHSQWQSMGLHNTTEAWPLSFTQIYVLVCKCMQENQNYFASLFAFAYGCQQTGSGCESVLWRNIVNVRLDNTAMYIEIIVKENRYRLRGNRNERNWCSLLIEALDQHSMASFGRRLDDLTTLSPDILNSKIWNRGSATHSQQLRMFYQLLNLPGGYPNFGSLREGGVLDQTLKKPQLG